jgi:hypothetical protein
MKSERNLKEIVARRIEFFRKKPKAAIYKPKVTSRHIKNLYTESMALEHLVKSDYGEAAMESEKLKMGSVFLYGSVNRTGQIISDIAFILSLVVMMSTFLSCCLAADKKVTENYNYRIKVCRLNNPPPEGYLAVAYVADPVQCPNPPGYQIVYTAMIIENYEYKHIGARMEICNGQPVPKGWVAVGPSHGIACLREPGDPTVGPTSFVIERTK